MKVIPFKKAFNVGRNVTQAGMFSDLFFRESNNTTRKTAIEIIQITRLINFGL